MPAADKALAWSLDLARLDASTRRTVVAMLRRLEKELTAKLGGDVTEWSKARISQQMAEASATITQHYAAIAKHTADITAGVYEISSINATTMLAAMTDLIPSILPAEAVMRAITTDAIIMGATQSAWWKRQAADVAFRFATAVRQGLVAAETNQQIIKRVRAELDITRRNAATLVQTSVQTVANDARMATFQANADIIQGVRWLATLDNKTCAQCGAMDGQTWKLDGTPINATAPMRNPPLHFNDRCVMTPITRFSDMGSGQRASDQGPVDRKITFEDFLSRQSDAYKADVLGKGRAELWADGKITLADLTNGQGRPLTLIQLRTKYGKP